MLSRDRSTPNLISDNLQARYQKALKQINKLIIANNQARESQLRKDKLLQTLEAKYAKTSLLLEQTQAQKKQLQLQLYDLTIKYQQLQEQNLQQCKSPTVGDKTKKKVSGDFKTGKDLDFGTITSKKQNQLKKKIQQYSDKNYQQLTKIEQLQKLNQIKGIKIQNLSSQCMDLKQKAQQLQKIKSQLSVNHTTKKQYLYQNENQNYDDLSKSKAIRKLKIQNSWVRNINNQCTKLQAKVIQLQRNQKYASIKSQRASQRLSSPISSVRSTKHGVGFFNDYMAQNQGQKRFTQILKRGKRLQSQNKILKQKYQLRKVQIDRIIKQGCSDKKQIQVLRKKNQGYQKIIQKQQIQMKNIMDQYENDISNITQEFKQKLNQQRKFMSQGDIQKRMKENQQMDSENKTLRKKFQKISLQLTKCYKNLEYQKAKVAQFESSFKQIAEENYTLKQKIKNMSVPIQKLSIKLQSPRKKNDMEKKTQIQMPTPRKKNYLETSVVQSEKIPIRSSFKNNQNQSQGMVNQMEI